MDGFESNWPISLAGRETDKPETTKKQAKDFFREKWTVLQRAHLIYSRIDYNLSPKRPWSFPGGAVVKKKKSICQCRRHRRCKRQGFDTWGGPERSPGVGMATHSSILAWKIPWTEEPSVLKSMGLQRVR